MARSVAAIFAHADDEVLGCGGALALHAGRGDRVRILLLATGLAARGPVGGNEVEALRRQARRAADVLGAEATEFADFPDNAMDSVPLLDVVRRVEAFLADYPAQRIYTHHGGDLNIDHQVVQRAVMTACRPLPGRGELEILGGEVNSSTEWAAPPLAPFVPTDFLDIAATLETKITALECYSGELHTWPHPRSADGARALARWRGCQVGLDAVEAFVTLRRVRSGGAAAHREQTP